MEKRSLSMRVSLLIEMTTNKISDVCVFGYRLMTPKIGDALDGSNHLEGLISFSANHHQWRRCRGCWTCRCQYNHWRLWRGNYCTFPVLEERSKMELPQYSERNSHRYLNTANWYLFKKKWSTYVDKQHLPNFQISNSNISNLDLADANSASIACSYLIPSNFQKPRERCKQLKTFRSKSGHFKTNLNIITMQAFNADKNFTKLQMNEKS